MKVQIKYMCEICDKVYVYRNEALECEERHITPESLEIYDIKYTARHTDMPNSIRIKSYNSLYTYKLCED